MKNIKSYKEFTMTNEEIFGFGELEEEKLDPKTKSSFFPNMTFEDLAKKYKVTPEYISEFEIFLKDNIDMHNVKKSDINEEGYEFHLTNNFPEYYDEVGEHPSHHTDI